MTLLDAIPNGGLVALDTMIRIYESGEHPTYGPMVRPVFAAIGSDRLSVGSSLLTLGELLVRPIALGRGDLADVYRRLFATGRGFVAWEVTREVVEKAAEVRATYRLKMMDALHVATAIVRGADAFVTNDGDLARVREIRVLCLDTLLAGELGWRDRMFASEQGRTDIMSREADPESVARSAFASAFGGDPAVVAIAPSRVELLGNHTDYNGGLVLAAAIDRFTAVVGRRRQDQGARAVAANFGGRRDEFQWDRPIDKGEPGEWTRYVRGVCWAMKEDGWPVGKGFEAAIAGDVPLGAGLSSSASLQAAVGAFVLGIGGGGTLDDPDRMRLANTLRKSENQFVGVASGLLDQFSVLFGRQGHALVLDCRSLGYERVPLGDPAPAIVVCDSKTSRRLADGMYNTRREECERVVSFYQRRWGETAVHTLRDVRLEDLEADWDALDVVGRLRARHVLTENDRVTRGAEALKRGDVAEFGELMSASHASSRDDFANSSAALDALIDAAESSPGFLGGKLSGAGWAGCTVNLVDAGRAADFAEAVRSGYARTMGVEPAIHVCHAADGASSRAISL